MAGRTATNNTATNNTATNNTATNRSATDNTAPDNTATSSITVESASTRWLDEHEQAVWRGFLRMTNALAAHLNRNLITNTGLSDGDYGVLVSLSEADGSRLRSFELARQIQWEKSRLSHQLTRMANRGLVRREECPSDARGAFIVLTEAGRESIERAAPRHVDDVRTWFFDRLSPDQLETLDEIVATVLAGLAPECAAVAATECLDELD